MLHLFLSLDFGTESKKEKKDKTAFSHLFQN